MFVCILIICILFIVKVKIKNWFSIPKKGFISLSVAMITLSNHRHRNFFFLPSSQIIIEISSKLTPGCMKVSRFPLSASIMLPNECNVVKSNKQKSLHHGKLI